MSTLSLHTELLHGREAYVLENGRIRVSALRGGGHLGEVRFLSDEPNLAINPMYVPRYQTIEPYNFDDDQHCAIYGEGPHRRLSAGYMGHLLCFPTFGPPSADEAKHDFCSHGEAVESEWQAYKPAEINEKSITFFYGADLVKTQYRVERAVTLLADETVVHVEEWIENRALFDRPFHRNQHATFGAPFAMPGKNMLDMSGGAGMIQTRPVASPALDPGGIIAWPYAIYPDGTKIDLRPEQSKPECITYYAVMSDQARPTSYFTLYNVDYPLLVGYLFPTADNPWIIDWQENQGNKRPPVNGQMIARGIEFGTTPLGNGLRKSVEQRSLLGMPTHQWIGGGQRLKTTFTIFLAEIPPNFQGVANIQTEAGQIIVSEHGSARQMRIACSI